MQKENQQFLRTNPLENHPNYIFGDPRNSSYRLNVIVNQPKEENMVGDIIIYDRSICSTQFLIHDFERRGSINADISYLNGEGYFLLSSAEILTIHSDKLKFFKAKQILNSIMLWTLILIIPIFIMIWLKPNNDWLISILFIILLLVNFFILKSGVFDWKKIKDKLFK
jgi:hypothetical protein